ncbi:GvpL/GvpF family gas vesicle protein [Streptomyces sp. RKCA744]|uniref:GvpL/GvpF family gas vesicle protein n=1 Tax=Streptomyces sp. RKCA744 TaxID=2959340 RepID=UPI00209D516F|nr:GvpL/GvpF family gas vesicle protein [Streptomyces sp. RKCA744]MCO8307485.1 GvpL/GvpF family gas vesicle protein [Streptomyces sp. RKCA744]
MTPPEPAALVYVFAVCRGGDLTALAELPGLGTGAPVRTLAAGPLTAVVQDVPAAGFGEEALRQRLSDRDELERCARAHHAVITAVSALVPAVPLPLATLYLDDGRVREALGERRTSFLTALDRIAGRAEWGVKVYAPTGAPPSAPDAAPDADATPGPGAAPGPSRPAATGSGRAYLDRVRTRQRDREQRHTLALRAAERVDTVVRGLAVAARRLRPHGVEVTGKHRTHVLNAAYLLDLGRERELRAALASLRRDETDVQIELSGPWAPYSFADGGIADGRIAEGGPNEEEIDEGRVDERRIDGAQVNGGGTSP